MKIKSLSNTTFFSRYDGDREFLKQVADYANAGGGIVYFGVEPDGTVVGSEIYAHTIAEIDEIINSSIRPKVATDIFKQKIDNKEILAIRVNSFSTSKLNRDHARFSIIDGNELIPEVRFSGDKNDIPELTPIEDYQLNTRRLGWYLTLSKRIADPSQMTRKQMDIFLNESKLLISQQLSVPGMMLFGEGESIAGTNPFAYTECRSVGARKQSDGIRSRFQGNLFYQIESAADFMILQISSKLKKIADESGKVLDFPYHILQSILGMAACYRDYSLRHPLEIIMQGRDIEIIVPGMKEEQLHLGPGYSSAGINTYPQILSAMRQVGYFQDQCNYQYLVSTMRQYNLKLPSLRTSRNGFVILFKLQERSAEEPVRRRDRDVDDRKRQMLKLVRQNPAMTLEDISVKLNISKATAKLYSLQLQEEGLVARTGSRRRGRWVIPD